MDAEAAPAPLPRLKLDLARLAGNMLIPAEGRNYTEAEMVDHLWFKGWEERDGWWAPPSVLEWELTVYAATERESPAPTGS